MKYISKIWSHIVRYKYPIIIIIGLLYVGVLEENSWLKRYQNKVRISEMREEIKIYNDKNEQNMKKLKALKTDPKATRDIAREKYFMKEANEDLFVLSDD